jgi:hypothetical protein
MSGELELKEFKRKESVVAEFKARVLNIRYVVTMMFTQLYELENFIHETVQPLGWKYEHDELTGRYTYDAFIGRSGRGSTDTFGFHREDFVNEITDMCNEVSKVSNVLLRIQKLHMQLLQILNCRGAIKDDLRFVDFPDEDIMKELEPCLYLLSRIGEETAMRVWASDELTKVTDEIARLLVEIQDYFYISDGDRLIQILKDNRISKMVDVIHETPALRTEHPLVHAVVSAVTQSCTATPVQQYIRGRPYY